MRVLLTGGTGALGGWVIDELSGAGHELVGTWRTTPPPAADGRVDWVRSDLADPTALVDSVCGPVDAVVHLAAMLGGRCGQDPYGAFAANVGGTATALEAARLLGARRAIVMSSKAVYGNSVPDGQAIDESFPPAPNDFYGRTKLTAEIWAEQFCADSGMECARFRLSSTFGPGKHVEDGGPRIHNVIGLMIESAYRGTPVEIERGGDQINDFVFYGDVAVAVRLALESSVPISGPYHVASGRPTYLRQVVEAVQEVFPDFTAQIGPGHDYAGLGAGRYGVLSPAKAAANFGFVPRTLADCVAGYAEKLT